MTNDVKPLLPLSARVARKYPEVRDQVLAPALMLGNYAHALIDHHVDAAQRRPMSTRGTRTAAFTNAVQGTSAQAAGIAHHIFGVVDSIGVGTGRARKPQTFSGPDVVRNQVGRDTQARDRQSRAGAIAPILDAASHGLAKVAQPPLAWAGGIVGELTGSVAGAPLGPVTLGRGPSSDDYRRGGEALGRDVGIGISRLITVLPFCLVKQTARLVTAVVRGAWIAAWGIGGAMVGIAKGAWAAANTPKYKDPEKTPLLDPMTSSSSDPDEVRIRTRRGHTVTMPA